MLLGLANSSYIRQFVCLTIAPAFVCASIYLCLARIIIAQGADFSRLAPRTYSILFVGCDIISLLLQSIGGGITANAKTQQKEDLGINIMIAGMAVQVCSLLLFMGLWIEFTLRRRTGSVSSEHKSDPESDLAQLRNSFRFRAFQIGMFVS
jgi:hypothetical protein